MSVNLLEMPPLAQVTRLANNAEPTVLWMSGILGALLGTALLVVTMLVITAIISTMANDDTSKGGKLLWAIFILWFPFFGAIAWFVVGKKGHLNRFLGIDKGRARHRIPVSVGQHSGAVPRQAKLEHV